MIFDGQNGHVFSLRRLQTVVIYEIIKQGDFMESKNSVLEFCWEKDISQNPVSSFFAMSPEQSVSSYLLPRVTMVTQPSNMVEVDPDDKIVFTQPISSQTEHIFTKMMWCNTVDKYLCQYYMLKKVKMGAITCDIELPESIFDKYKNYASRGKNRKMLEVNDSAFVHHRGKGKTKTDSSTFWTYEFLKPLYMNRLFRSLWTTTDAHKQKNSPYYDGLLFCHKDAPGWLPKYDIEDYIAHEWLTGISLSIEITSVLMEFGKKEEDKALMKKALGAFCEQVLPTIIQSPAIFARNAAARYFFHQIRMENDIKKYRWGVASGKMMNDTIWSEYEWNELIYRAKLHVTDLPLEIDSYEIEDKYIDEALSWLVSLLKKVELPINFLDYAKNPTHGLAAFCHPSHKNVPLFLNLLSERKGEDNTYIAISDADEEELFRDVHKLVREACKNHTGTFFIKVF